MQLSHLRGWRALEAVLRLGSVAAAAEELGVTPAAISAQVRGLEDRLGRSLFERGAAGLVPMADVGGLRDRLTAGFAALEGVQTALSDSATRDAVAITTTLSFAETWLLQHMPDLYARIGSVNLRLQATPEVVDLRRGEFDFAIRHMGPPGPEFCAVDLFRSGAVPVCTPDFATRYGLGPHTATLDGIPLIHIDIASSDPDWVAWQTWSQRTGRAWPARSDAPQIALQASSTRMARSGIGLVLGGLPGVLPALADGSLVMPFGEASVIWGAYRFRLIWLKARRLGKVQRAVRDWIVESAEADRARMPGQRSLR